MMATAIKRANLQGGARGNGRRRDRIMSNQELETPQLNPGVREAVDVYLKFLDRKKLMPSVDTAVWAAKTEYETSG